MCTAPKIDNSNAGILIQSYNQYYSEEKSERSCGMKHPVYTPDDK